MFGWFRIPAARASCSKRRRRSASVDKDAGRTLMATSRPSRGSFARQTSPMPPAPICERTSYGPRRDPDVSVMREAEILARRRSAASADGRRDPGNAAGLHHAEDALPAREDDRGAVGRDPERFGFRLPVEASHRAPGAGGVPARDEVLLEDAVDPVLVLPDEGDRAAVGRPSRPPDADCSEPP